MWYLCTILIIWGCYLEGSVAKADEASTCAGVQTQLQDIDDSLQEIKDTVEDLEDPTEPPTSTLQILNMALNKYKTPHHCNSEYQEIIEEIPSKILALNAELKNTITQYTLIRDELKNKYAAECNDPSSQSSETLAEQSTKALKTILQIQRNETDQFNNMTESAEKLQQNVFACFLIHNYESLRTAMDKFNTSVDFNIQAERRVVSSILAKKLTHLQFATERIQHYDREHQNEYMHTCNYTAGIDQTINATFTALYESVDDIRYNLDVFFTDNTLKTFSNAMKNVRECIDIKCIDSQMETMQTAETTILNNIATLRYKNVTSLTETAILTAVNEFNSLIEKQFDCYLKIFTSGSIAFSLSRMPMLHLIVLVLFTHKLMNKLRN